MINIFHCIFLTFFISIAFSQQDTGKFTDERDGQEYRWVKIGKQIWMAQNLNVNKVYIIRDSELSDYSVDRLCYRNDITNCIRYGGLYRWDVMLEQLDLNGVNGPCPSGWHIPSYNEWQILINFLGGPEVAGGRLKEPGTAHWATPNTGATDSIGFNALPAGWGAYGSFNAGFVDVGKSCIFWSSSSSWSIIRDQEVFKTIMLTHKKSRVYWQTGFSGYAISVRCIRD